MSQAIVSSHSFFPLAAIGVGFFVAVLFFTALIVGIEVVIIYAVINAIRKYDDPLVKIDARSGKGKMSEVPTEIKGWNWAAAFLPNVWGVYHRSWLFLLRYVPFLGWIWWIIMGIKGSEWAWRNNQWESVERFKRAQARWRPVGIVCFILNLLMIPYLFFVFTAWYNVSHLQDYSTFSPSMYNLPARYNDYNKNFYDDTNNTDGYFNYNSDNSPSDDYFDNFKSDR
jgi:hypothetical protein